MTRRVLCLTFVLAVTACTQESKLTVPYGFVGSWDYEVSTFTFTNSTYNNGSESYSIQSVSQQGRDYVLRFAGGYTIALAAVTETGMTWVSGASGDQFNCRRVK